MVTMQHDVRFIPLSSSDAGRSSISSTLDYSLPPKRTLKEKLCDRRLIVLIVVLVVMFILAVVSITVGVLLFNRTLNASNASTSESSGSQNGFSSTVSVSTSSPIWNSYDVGRGGASNDPPCISHTVVNDSTRSISASGTGGRCDFVSVYNTSIGGRWVRFVGPGGTIMPTSSIGINHCSAFMGGWFNGTMPNVDGIIEEGYACFDSTASICNFLAPISVVKCGTFYVYFLQGVDVCNARYCTV